MPKRKDSKFSMNDYFILSPSLRSYFGNVENGQSEVYTTPFAKGESTESLLSSWNEVLVSIQDRWPTLYEFESDMAGKVGPLSVRLPISERISDIEAYYEGIRIPSAPISTSAVNAVIQEWAKASTIRLRSQSETWRKMRHSTNSGSPFFAKRRAVVDKTIPCTVMQHGAEVLQNLKDGLEGQFLSCAVIGWRGQEGGHSKDDVKQRVVWMFPMAVNIVELQVYQPLTEYAQRFGIVPAWVGNDDVDRVITRMFDTKGENDLVVATDFTKFDQHFNSSLQAVARTVIASRLNKGASETNWLNYVFPIKFMIPMCYEWDKVMRGPHGMGSGSGGTNFDETLAHRALQYEAAQLAGERLNPNSQCLGDDGILTYPGITVEEVVEAYKSHGLEMNDSKQYASTRDTVYLRRWHHKDYRVNGVAVGVYSTMRALGRMRYLERFMDPEIWSAEAVELRWYSILENVKYHPLREQFVDYCMKRDKYRLGLDLPDFLDKITDVTKKYIELMPDFLGYRATLNGSAQDAYGIANWWIVNYLKSIR